MAQFELKILSNNADEFETLCARFLGSAGHDALARHNAAVGGASENGDEPSSDTEEQEAPKKPRTRRTKASDTAPRVPTQEPDGTPIPPIYEPEPQPTPGGTDAPPAESIPPNQGKADVFDTSATPAASSPKADAAEASGDVTMQQLKDAMANLLKVKSAGVAMKTLEDATGCKSLSSGSPSVAEKAKDNPSIMQKTLDALNAAAAA